MHTIDRGPVTPNRMKTAKRELRKRTAEYVSARRAALAACKATPIADKRAGRYNAAMQQREHLLCEAWMARRWVFDAVHLIAHYEKRGVQLGAAWSERGLKRVQRANGKDQD